MKRKAAKKGVVNLRSENVIKESLRKRSGEMQSRDGLRSLPSGWPGLPITQLVVNFLKIHHLKTHQGMNPGFTRDKYYLNE